MDGPAAFGTLLIDVTDDFDRAPRGAASETFHRLEVSSGMPFSSYVCSFRVLVACTVDKCEPLALSPEMAMELNRIRAAKQYPMLTPTLFPGNLATRERPYNTLATSWTVFALLKHNTSPTIDGDAFARAFKGSSSHGHPIAIFSASPTASLHRNTRL